MSPTGVQGEMQLLASAIEDDFSDERLVIFQANIKWDSPVTRQRNVFNVTKSEEMNDPRITFKCKDDFNKRGGALGNIDCKIEGVYREKKVIPPEPEADVN